MDTEEQHARFHLARRRVTKRRELLEDLLCGKITAREVLKSALLAVRYGVLPAHRSLRALEKELERLYKEECGLAFLGTPTYPPGLLRLPTPPLVLSYRGTMPLSTGVAIVGSRAAHRGAMIHSYNLAAHAGRRLSTVVSGGAYGVDGAAHRGALYSGANTVVVLGSGLGHPYPERHLPLFEDIVAAQGAVLSTFPWDQPPLRGAFISRNRVIAALARVVFVVAASLSSGARHTAHAATDLGIPLYALPGTPGCDRLITEGARAYTNPTLPKALFNPPALSLQKSTQGGRSPRRAFFD